MQTYRQNFCHKAPYIWRILLKKFQSSQEVLLTFVIFLKIMTHLADGFKLVDFITAVHTSFILYNDDISTLKMWFLLANLTKKEKMNRYYWSPISPFRCQAVQLLILWRVLFAFNIAMAYCLGGWVSSPGVRGSKPLGGSKVNPIQLLRTQS